MSFSESIDMRYKLRIASKSYPQKGHKGGKCHYCAIFFCTFQLCDFSFARHPICATFQLCVISIARHFKCATTHLRDFFLMFRPPFS